LTVYADSVDSRANYLYPVSVWENFDDGKREIIRTYELKTNERPENISRESFARDGWLYELAEITKQETSNADARDYSETVTIETATNEMTAILQELEPTMNYQSDDGYAGVLRLDISSIKVESAGTKSSSFAVTATREYPHLSSNDTSLIPKTITDNGRTLTLSGIDWRVQNYITVDYDRIPESYTAVATYTGTGWRTTTIGYVTTAEYIGIISKILPGRTVYTAYFIGAPIITADECESSDATPDTTKTDLPNGTISETMPLDEADPEPEQEFGINNILPVISNHLPIIIGVLAGAAICGIILLVILKKPQKPTKRRKPINVEKTN